MYLSIGYIGVSHFGGNPVVCDFIVYGPIGTVYEGGNFKLSVTFVPGYPYRVPVVVFKTRIFSINVITQVSQSFSVYMFPAFYYLKYYSRKRLAGPESCLI
jgi:hypothetical protein